MSNFLKAISSTDDELRVGNYIVLFGGKDLTGEFFTQKTAFESQYTSTGVMYIDFEHGRDSDMLGNARSNVLGIVDWRTARADEKGIFVERVLTRRAKYVKYLEELITAGVVGTSSEADPKGITKKTSGEIVEWPLVRDSLTVTPMEPRMAGENVIHALKSLSDEFPHSRSIALALGKTADEPEARLEAISAIQDLRSAEKHLRDSGFSQREAMTLISRIKNVSRSDCSDELTEVISMMKSRPFPIK